MKPKFKKDDYIRLSFSHGYQNYKIVGQINDFYKLSVVLKQPDKPVWPWEAAPSYQRLERRFVDANAIKLKMGEAIYGD